MTVVAFKPTDEQARIIGHNGPAFVSACPGSGKTRVLVERARGLIGKRWSGRGIAFLSFTIAAVTELEGRLQSEGLLSAPSFPHFIGTFDSFLWQFFIAPFGVPGSTARPRLIPDKDQWLVRPFAGAQALPLECFDRSTGNAIPAALARQGFKGRSATAHETAARNTRLRFSERAELDFTDARELALTRLQDAGRSPALSRALSARFLEVIVDEAQDCNPADLQIIGWFRSSNVPVKVICDPYQSIYGFRGGITDELIAFGKTFKSDEVLPMSGNFRSSSHITKAIVALRPATARANVDVALGPDKDESSPVYVLSYPGNSVPATVGAHFHELTEAMQLDPIDCPVVAATRLSGANALGHPTEGGIEDMTYRLAIAISDYHLAFELGGRKEALEAIHKIMLELEGHTSDKTYHQHVSDAGLEPNAWRPKALNIATALRYDPTLFATTDLWHDRARELLAPLLPAIGQTINQRLRRNTEIGKALVCAPLSGHCAKTIHAVKGKEFPAVCVVMSTSKAKGIIDYLTTGNPAASSEEARKIYVGASRARRLLAIAIPKSQSARLVALLQATGATVKFVQL